MDQLPAILARLVQFGAAVVLFGSPLFYLYAMPARGLGAAAGLAWPRSILWGAAWLQLAAGLVALVAQAANMAGSLAEAASPGVLSDVLFGTQFGHGMLARLLLTVAVLLSLALIPRARPRWTWGAVAVLAGAIAASFAWTGHGAADEGTGGLVHLVSDVLHLLAGGVWLGALIPFAVLIVHGGRRLVAAELQSVHDALARFSGVGTALVAVLLATGLVNSWFLVGPAHIADLPTSAYGQLLLAKIALFGGMLACAAANRFLLTPRLAGSIEGGQHLDRSVRALRASLLIETGLGFAVLVVVGVLGVLAPLSAA